MGVKKTRWSNPIKVCFALNVLVAVIFVSTGHRANANKPEFCNEGRPDDKRVGSTGIGGNFSRRSDDVSFVLACRNVEIPFRIPAPYIGSASTLSGSYISEFSFKMHPETLLPVRDAMKQGLIDTVFNKKGQWNTVEFFMKAVINDAEKYGNNILQIYKNTKYTENKEIANGVIFLGTKYYNPKEIPKYPDQTLNYIFKYNGNSNNVLCGNPEQNPRVAYCTVYAQLIDHLYTRYSIPIERVAEVVSIHDRFARHISSFVVVEEQD